MKIFRRLLTYTSKYKARLVAGILLSFLVSVFNGASLTSMIPIFDSMGNSSSYKFQISVTKRDKIVLEKESKGQSLSRLEGIELKLAHLKLKSNEYLSHLTPYDIVLLFIKIVFPVYILKLICLAGAVYFIQSTGARAIRDLRLEVYRTTQILPLNFFVKEKTGILMSRIINDVDILGKIISTDLKDAIIDFFYILTHLLLLFFLSWKMFLLVFVVIPVVMGPITAFAEKIRKATRNQQERLSALNGHLQEMIAGIRVIRAFSMEARESSKFSQINHELSEKTFKGHFYHQVGPSLVEFFGAIVAAILLSFGAYLMTMDGFSKGMFLAFFITLIFLMSPIKKMSIMYNLIQSAVSAGERVFEIIDSKPDLVDPVTPKVLPPKIQEIELKNITYNYPGTTKSALQNINLKVSRGETIAFVGPSGAGKSTLKDILGRLADPTSGQYLIDGVDVREFTIHDVRARIGIVTQEVFLFNASVKENLAMGNPMFTDAQIRKAAEDAFALEFIENLENGFDTMIGENGVMLSGGQRQRLSIARAILYDPEILILDEATSALDTESERQVQIALESIFKKRTTFIIAHRLSTIQIANKIAYMEHGEILEMGTHNELMELNGKYKELYNHQFEGI